VIAGRYERKPDCFRRAAGRIRVRCGEIDLDADQRVKGTLLARIHAIHYNTICSRNFYDSV
jgi:hypothetical protein